jgi:hypothetical protein
LEIGGKAVDPTCKLGSPPVSAEIGSEFPLGSNVRVMVDAGSAQRDLTVSTHHTSAA